MITVTPSRFAIANIVLIALLGFSHLAIQLVLPLAAPTPLSLLSGIGALILGGVLALLVHRRTRVWISDGRVHKRSWLGTEWSFPVDAVVSVIDARNVRARGMDEQVRLALFDADGAALLRLSGEFWNAGQLDRFVLHFADRRRVLTSPLRPADLAEVHPASVSVYEAKPWLPVVLVAAAVIAVIVGFSVANPSFFQA